MESYPAMEKDRAAWTLLSQARIAVTLPEDSFPIHIIGLTYGFAFLETIPLYHKWRLRPTLGLEAFKIGGYYGIKG